MGRRRGLISQPSIATPGARGPHVRFRPIDGSLLDCPGESRPIHRWSFWSSTVHPTLCTFGPLVHVAVGGVSGGGVAKLGSRSGWWAWKGSALCKPIADASVIGADVSAADWGVGKAPRLVVCACQNPKNASQLRFKPAEPAKAKQSIMTGPAGIVDGWLI